MNREWLRSHRPTPSVAIAFTALVVATSGVAVASIPDAGGVITACVNPGTQVRFVDTEAGDACKKNEREVSFNHTGPQGPVGATGPQGAPGISGLERVVASSPFSSEFSRTVTATCPAGKKVIGTAYNIDGADSATAGAVVMDEVLPSADLQSVRAYAFEIRPGSTGSGTDAVWNLSAIAICAYVAP